ncbi:MAG: efflux RND transporter periplasmic adaptor subunit [Pyrinomonadaceae bacterium]
MIFSKPGLELSVRRVFLISILVLTAFFAACNRSESKAKEQADANQQQSRNEVFTVSHAPAEMRQVPSVIQATGSLVAEETSNIAPKVAGKITNVNVNVGDFVGQGSVIAKVDEKNAQLQLAQAKAAVNQTLSAVRQAEARLGLAQNGAFSATAIPEVRVANANYEQAFAQLRQAEANEKRYRELVETGDVAVATYEGYRTARDTARAQVNSAEQQLEAAKNTARQSNEAVKSAQAAVESAQTQVALANQAVADTIVRAPFAGFISNRPVAVGEFVSTATVVATILRTNPIKAQLQVTEANVPYVSLGRAVSIEVDAYKDRKFGGTVTAINPAVDPTTRSAIVEVSIENNENALRTGMFATSQIVRQGGSDGVFIPKAAVYNDQATQSYRVFVIQNGAAKLRVVQLGTEENDYIQILSGVNADETVATSNLEKLYEGAKVQF